jgi:DeoR family transcriptional regulator of aga operon
MQIKNENDTLKRRSTILDLLEKRGDISVVSMSKMFKVSEVTIRNDLAKLEEKGLLIRTRGGAIKKVPITYDLSLNQRLNKNKFEKQKIGKRAMEYIKNGDTIVMDSGSTTLEVAKNLKAFKDIKLITNSLPIADLVADFNGVEVIVPGGILRKEMRSLIGPMAERNLMNYHCDIAFLAVDGIEANEGIYTPVIHEATLCQIMMQVSNKVVVVCDSSKFLRKSFVKIAPISDVDIIITDTGIPAAEKARIKELQVELVIV